MTKENQNALIFFSALVLLLSSLFWAVFAYNYHHDLSIVHCVQTTKDPKSCSEALK